MTKLDGKVALVTGGGRGLGAEISKLLGQEGATVVVADIRDDLARSTSDSIQRAGGRSLALAFDVGNLEQANRAVARIRDELGRLDIVVNNAARDITCSIEELSHDDWESILTTNLSGPFNISKAAFPIMKAQRAGSIVNIVSTASKRAWANACVYHASKWGLLGLSHALHVEGRKENIKVSAIVAGGMRTPFLLERFPDIDPDLLQDPKNVANAVLFALTQPMETVIPEIMVLPMRETSWP